MTIHGREAVLLILMMVVAVHVIAVMDAKVRAHQNQPAREVHLLYPLPVKQVIKQNQYQISVTGIKNKRLRYLPVKELVKQVMRS